MHHRGSYPDRLVRASGVLVACLGGTSWDLSLEPEPEVSTFHRGPLMKAAETEPN